MASVHCPGVMLTKEYHGKNDPIPEKNFPDRLTLFHIIYTKFAHFHPIPTQDKILHLSLINNQFCNVIHYLLLELTTVIAT